MDWQRLPKRLISTFLGEMDERVSALNRDLLALEQAGPDGPQRSDLIRELFRSAHSLKGAAGAIGLAEIAAACHTLEDTFDSISAGRVTPDTALMQGLFAAIDGLQSQSNNLRAEIAKTAEPPPPPRPAPPPATPPAAAPPTAAFPVQPASPVTPQDEMSPSHGQAANTARFARIPVERLDTLLLRSGELLLARNRATARLEDANRVADALAQLRSRQHLANAAGLDQSGQYVLTRLSKDLERLIHALAADRRELERAAMPLDDEIRDLRMLPFGDACAGLERSVRDIAVASGKEAQLRLEGGDMPLDRAILDGLKAPLLHLVRNAVDHGIEMPEQRTAQRKSRIGTVTISARMRGTSIEVAVADDGTGADMTAIREQARRNGLPQSDEASLMNYIFRPRFSTARTTTEISGRGVGLDAVKSAIEGMRGTIEVTSAPRRGMRFTMTLPLTLSTIRALLVEAGGQIFAVDSANIEGLYRVSPGKLRLIEGQRAFAAPGGLIPLASLSRVLDLRVAAPAAGAKLAIMVLAVGQRRMAFEVDALVGEQEAVVRNLGPRLVRLRNFVGGTLLPTGRIALILNAASIMQAAMGMASLPTPAAEAQARTAPVRRVLLADDSVTTRAVERSALESEGFSVMAAANGAEAWQLLLEHGADIVVTDVDMPVMDGFQLTEAIRGSVRFANLPVILVTARESDADKERGLRAGASAYLTKSAFDRHRLIDAIAELL